MKTALVILLVLLPGGSLLIGALWLRRQLRAREHDPKIEALIVPPVYGHGMEKHDDSLRLRTEARRKQADSIHARANNIETGEPVEQLIRLVK